MQPDPSLLDICQLANNEEAASVYLKEHGFGAIPTCPQCASLMTPRQGKADIFRCSPCNISRSYWHDTVFSNCKKGKGMILLLGFLWITGATTTQMIKQTKFSSATICKWLKVFRNAVANDIDEHNDDNKIGGPDIIVEIDESKFGKRKHHRGHQVNGVWVVGGVERTPERKMFAVAVQDRSAETLLDIVERWVHPGSLVYTDCWKGYKEDGLLDLEMHHSTVNRSLHFKDPETGVHTNTIEGTWAGMKEKISRRARTEEAIAPCLLEFIWRRKHEEHLWEGFLLALRLVMLD
jgi:transposase-like protein